MSEGETDLHGGLAVRLLEVCVVNIYRHCELTRFATSSGRGERTSGKRVDAHQVVILGLHWCHGSSIENPYNEGSRDEMGCGLRYKGVVVKWFATFSSQLVT